MSAPRTTQARLFSLDKAPLVTPRASSSVPGPSHRQTNLEAFANHAAQARDKRKPKRKSSLGPRERGVVSGMDTPRRLPEAFSRRAGATLQVYRDDQGLGNEEAEENPISWTKSVFKEAATEPAKQSGTASSHAPSSSSSSGNTKNRSVAHKMLSKPARRGPTIEFDRELDPDLSYSQEMLGERERRKQRRIEGSGPALSGKLEMCDAEDHEGFGSPQKRRRSRRLSTEGRPSPRAGTRRSVFALDSGDARRGGDGTDANPFVVVPSQRQLERHHSRPVPPSPRAPSPRKRSRAAPPASPAWLVPPTPSPASSGSSAESTAAALQAQLVPPREQCGRYQPPSRHPSSCRFVEAEEPVVLVPESDPPEPSLEDLESGSEPSTLESSGSSGSAKSKHETTGAPAFTPRKGHVPDPAPETVRHSKRHGDDSTFSEGGLAVTSDDATPRPLPPAATRGSTHLDLTVLATSSPTVPQQRRTARPHVDDPDEDQNVGTSAQLGRTASGVLMPPPPLPVSPQKRQGRLRKGAPSTRAADLAEKKAAAAAAAAAAAEDRSPPETMMDGTQYLLPDGRSGLGDEVILVADSYPFLFAHVPRPNPAKGYTPIRFDTQGDAHLPTPHAKDSPLLHRQSLEQQQRDLQPATSSPIRTLTALEAGSAGGPDSPRRPDRTAPGAAAASAAVVNWGASVAPAWEGARPPSPTAPRQSRLGEFFAPIPSSQAHRDGRELGADDSDETQLVEDSQVGGVGESAADEVALLRAVMQLRPRMEEMRTAKPLRGRHMGEVNKVAGSLDAVLEEEQIDSPSKPSTPVKPELSRPSSSQGPVAPSVAVVAALPSSSPSPSPSQYVDDSDPEGDATVSPLVAGKFRSASASPTKPSTRRRWPRWSLLSLEGDASDPPTMTMVRYSPTKAKRAAAAKTRRQDLNVDAGGTELGPSADEVEPVATAADAAAMPQPDRTGHTTTTNLVPEGAATGATQWESYWSYPSQPAVDAADATSTEVPPALDCSPRKLAELIAKVKALPPDLPPDWAVDEHGELYRLNPDRWDPDQYPITESLLHVLD